MNNRSLLPFAVALSLSGAMAQDVMANESSTQLVARAEQGDVSAMLQLGQGYLTGYGADMDVPRGIEMLERVIARNGPQAAFAHTELAAYYERNLRTADDKARMFRHYRLAAGLGDTVAQTRLGKLLLDSVQSNQLEPGQADALRQQALMLLKHAQENGRAEAATELGTAYLFGRGVPRDVNEGMDWLAKAADAGDRVAAYTLGYQLLKAPKGSGYDADRGRRYLEQAAESSHKGAITALAEAHLSGEHWVADPAAAKRLAQIGVEVQAAGAQELLARAEAVLRAKEERLAAERRAAEASRQEAARLAQAAETARAEQEAARLAAQKKADEARVAEAARVAAEGLKRQQEAQLAAQTRPARPAAPVPMPAASRHVASGVIETASSIAQPVIAAATVTSAIPEPGEFLRQAGSSAERRIAELSSENTRLTQEVSYLRREIAEKDERISTLETTVSRSNDLMDRLEQRLARLDGGAPSPIEQRRATAETKPQAWNRAGLELFKAGDYQRALREFDRAAKAGNVEAMNNLGMAYLQGRGAPRNLELAMTLFRQAAEQGHATAANNIGYIYENGLGVVRDSARAQLWYRRAAHLNATIASVNTPTALDGGYRIVSH